MTNKELQSLLSEHPDDMPIKLYLDSQTVIDFTDENVILHSETAFIDDDAPLDEWDTEDGKVMLGDGRRYLLVNPPIS